MNSFERKIDDAISEMRRDEYTRNMLDVGSVTTSLIQGCEVMVERECYLHGLTSRSRCRGRTVWQVEREPFPRHWRATTD